MLNKSIQTVLIDFVFRFFWQYRSRNVVNSVFICSNLFALQVCFKFLLQGKLVNSYRLILLNHFLVDILHLNGLDCIRQSLVHCLSFYFSFKVLKVKIFRFYHRIYLMTDSGNNNESMVVTFFFFIFDELLYSIHKFEPSFSSNKNSVTWKYCTHLCIEEYFVDFYLMNEKECLIRSTTVSASDPGIDPQKVF